MLTTLSMCRLHDSWTLRMIVPVPFERCAARGEDSGDDGDERDSEAYPGGPESLSSFANFACHKAIQNQL